MYRRPGRAVPRRDGCFFFLCVAALLARGEALLEQLSSSPVSDPEDCKVHLFFLVPPRFGNKHALQGKASARVLLALPLRFHDHQNENFVVE